jgi:hypothetical protein
VRRHQRDERGENEDWLHGLSIEVLPEEGCLHVCDPGDDGVTAFTDYM